MYNYAGLIYRIWATDGLVLFLGLLLLVLEKPWKRGFKSKGVLSALLIIAVMLLFLGLNVYHLCAKNVSSYTGQFVESHRNSRVAPPLPFTKEYVFWNGEGKKQVYYLDSFSDDKIFLEGPPEKGKVYTIYFDESTNIIVKIDEVEQAPTESSP